MTTYTTFLKGGSTGLSESKRKPQVYEAIIDFSDRSAVTGDVFSVFTLPVGALVLTVAATVTTAVTGTGTITTPTYAVGDGTKTWLTGKALDATGSSVVSAVADTLADAAQTVKLTVTITGGGTITAGVVSVFAVVLHGGTLPPATTAVI